MPHSPEDRFRTSRSKLRGLGIKYDDMAKELRSLSEKDPESFSSADEARFSGLTAAIERTKDEMGAARVEARAAGEAFVTSPGVELSSGNGGLTGQARGETSGTGRAVVDQALRILDGPEARSLSPASKDQVDRLLRSESDNRQGSQIAERMLLTENEAYRSAFMKGVTQAQPIFTPEEARAINSFRDFERRTETRAASEGTGGAGGFGVPVLIDATIILTSGAVNAPLLQVCRMVTITTDAWKGVAGAGATWNWGAEAAVVTDGTPTLVQPTVPVYRGTGFIPFSIEIGQDYPGFADEMSRLLNQGYIDLLATSTCTGTGSAQPTGLFTHMQATTTSPAHVTVTTAGTLGGVDVRSAWNALPERYRPTATWVMNTSVESVVRSLGNNLALADFTVDMTADGISRLMGRPIVATDYAPAFTGTTGAENFLCVGDIQNFLVVQRAGMTVELVQHLFDPATARPTGQRGWLAYARVGHDVVNANGVRLLSNS